MLLRKISIYSYLAQKKLKRQLRKLSNRNEVEVFKLADDYDSCMNDDLPLTINRDPYPGFKMHEEGASAH